MLKELSLLISLPLDFVSGVGGKIILKKKSEGVDKKKIYSILICVLAGCKSRMFPPAEETFFFESNQKKEIKKKQRQKIKTKRKIKKTLTNEIKMLYNH